MINSVQNVITNSPFCIISVLIIATGAPLVSSGVVSVVDTSMKSNHRTVRSGEKNDAPECNDDGTLLYPDIELVVEAARLEEDEGSKK